MKGLIIHTLPKHAVYFIRTAWGWRCQVAGETRRRRKIKAEVRCKLGSALRGEEQGEDRDLLDRLNVHCSPPPPGSSRAEASNMPLLAALNIPSGGTSIYSGKLRLSSDLLICPRAECFSKWSVSCWGGDVTFYRHPQERRVWVSHTLTTGVKLIIWCIKSKEDEHLHDIWGCGVRVWLTKRECSLVLERPSAGLRWLLGVGTELRDISFLFRPLGFRGDLDTAV